MNTDLSNIQEIEKELGVSLRKYNDHKDWEMDIDSGYVLEDNQTIISLRLSRLKLISIPVQITRLKNIKSLSLTGNKLTDFSTLKKLPTITNLSLDNNSITDISTLNNFTNLKYVSIDFNKISSLPPLNKLKSLEILSIQENSLTDISNISELTHLKELYLANNKITNIESLANLALLKTLKLTNNNITNVIALGQLQNILKLDISHNGLNDCSSLTNFKKIKELELSHNKINNIDGFEHFDKLEHLNLWNNGKIDISPISNLKKLKFLDLCNIQLKNIDPLANLTNLTTLDLRNNQISDISVLQNLNKLKKLHLWNNEITNINILSHLTKLERLDLNHNEIKDLTPIEKLVNLIDLNLSDTKLRDLSFLNSLKKLTDLELEKNQITNIEPLRELSKLKRLNLNNNQIRIFPEWLINTKMKNNYLGDEFELGFRIQNNPIENIPIELLNQDKDAIRDYLKSLVNGALPINEIKVILLGEGAAGKTSLMNYLQGKPYNKDEPQTHGINLEKCTEAAGVTMKVWDFGGQDIMHHTHQFFLTQKSVYVLVVNARENTDIEKWLKLIQVFGGDSPVIIVTNKIDENPSDHENIKYLNTKYSNLNNRYVRISCLKGIGLNEFKDLLSSTINELLHVRTLWGNNWLGVKKELEAMRDGESLKDYIHFDVFESICDSHNVAKTHRDTLINWLHRLGVITYFPDTNLSETNVINPSWLTEAFYKIINSEKVAENFGRFDSFQLNHILNVERYPRQKHGFLLALMTKFELCYQIDNNNYLIPDLLNREEPEFEFNIASSLKFKYKYSNLLPKAILPKFMVRRHQEIKEDKKWRTGSLIRDSYFESEALIRVDEDDKEISIYVNGNEQRGYLAGIISTFESINNLYSGLEYEKLVPCGCNSCLNKEKPFYYNYDILKKAHAKGRKEYICQYSNEDVNISELLGILISREELESEIKDLIGKGVFKTKKCIEDGNTIGFIDTLKSLFSSVSYLLFEKTEKAYHTPLFILLRSIFSSSARADEIQSKGRADIILDIKNYLYVLELKLDGSADDALLQIHQNKYYEPYILESKKIILIGINFSSKTRNIENYKVELFKN